MPRLSIKFLLWLFLWEIFSSGLVFAQPIIIRPGDNIQKVVDENVEGATFLIKTGIHRLQQVKPKHGNVFLGEPGAVMSGAKLLTSFANEGQYYVANGQTDKGQVNGICQKNPDGTPYEGCKFSEDLFIDDVPLWRVTNLSEIGSGKWYFDYVATKIYLADDPTGHKVELSVTRHAFHGAATSVTIRGLIVEKYAVPAQHAAIQGQEGAGPGSPIGQDWLVEDNEVRLNHGLGVRTGDRMRVVRNRIHHNGQLGLGGSGNNILVEGNDIAYNNYAGFSSEWEAGGSKWVKTRNLVVRGNRAHHNKGPGLWTDIDNIYTLYTDNQVFENDGIGIFHEISYDAVIQNNIVKRNGRGLDVWLGGAQILLAGSRNVEVDHNVVEVDARGGNGIAMIQQNRGNGAFGPYITIGNYIHHNVITYLGNRGLSGAAADYEPDVMYNGKNLFDFNTYHAPRLDWTRWSWRGTKNWQGFRAEGQEPNGSAEINSLPAAPTDLEVIVK